MSSLTTNLSDLYIQVRDQTVALCDSLEVEDMLLQASPFVSPIKWHLGHTTWFFETFILKSLEPSYVSINPLYEHLFNSYYHSIGTPYKRSQRSLLSRPTQKEVMRYRTSIDEIICHWINTLEQLPEAQAYQLTSLLQLGLNHEQQHQELMLTDLHYNFSHNPLLPTYQTLHKPLEESKPILPLTFIETPPQLTEIGTDTTSTTFCFDNETPKHGHYLNGFALATRPITCAEFIEFIESDGYHRPELWLDEGWHHVQNEHWTLPLYWTKSNGQYHHFSLHGFLPIAQTAPIHHISFYEADAYARWAGMRLPSEQEWEFIARNRPIKGQFIDNQIYTPLPLRQFETSLSETFALFGGTWEWTQSPYSAYPGYRQTLDPLGEYNGKFMSKQMVLKGGSCLTPLSHIRPTYRNFFYPHERWQTMGFRLAYDLEDK